MSGQRSGSFISEEEEAAMLKLYNITNLNPTKWDEFSPSNARPPSPTANGAYTGARRGPHSSDPDAPKSSFEAQLLSLSTLAPGRWEPGSGGGRRASVIRPRGSISDGGDPLGLRRPSVIASIPSNLRDATNLSSKAFNPKIFLSTLHPNANFRDLSQGRDLLKDALDSRSEAMKLLVEQEIDRFVHVKSVTRDVYEDMRKGPLQKESDYSVGELREALKQAQQKADAVYHPILGARTKADRLRSTLSVFERGKFFFSLPAVMLEAIEAGKYEAALLAYKKGKYQLESRPAQLLGLNTSATQSEKLRATQQRIFEKVWNQVERIITDMKSLLAKKLKDTTKGVEEIEKTIELLLELDSSDETIWAFFDTRFSYIKTQLESINATAQNRLQTAIHKAESRFKESDETARALSAEAWVQALLAHEKSAATDAGDVDTRNKNASQEKTLSERFETILESSAGSDVWRTILSYCKNLNSIIGGLSICWKIAKGHEAGKYQKKPMSAAAAGNRRSPSQTNAMINETLTLYISLYSGFFDLSSAHVSSSSPNSPDSAASAYLPNFIPPDANALSASHVLQQIIEDVNESMGEMAGLGLAKDSMDMIHEFQSSLKWRFLDTVCSCWTRDAKLFHRLEAWTLNPDEPTTTSYLQSIAAYQRSIGRSAFRMCGGDEDRASTAFSRIVVTVPTSFRKAKEEPIPPDFTKRAQAAYIDALYAFLDGLVHVAFTEPEMLPSKSDEAVVARVHAQDMDYRVMLTISNLAHIRDKLLPRMIQQFETAFKVDIKSELDMLIQVLSRLDKVLFEDYVKRKSGETGQMLKNGILGGGINWAQAPNPTEVQPYIFDALLSLVFIHSQVTSVAKFLVPRVLSSLVEELAKEALACFSEVERFDMGGMLQATLEIEFLHQTLLAHVTPKANAILQNIYQKISQSFTRKTGDGGADLQKELETLRRTLQVARRATALQFLCFRDDKRKNSSSS